MFFGEYHCKIDAKGRFNLPVKFREQLENQVITATRGTDRNIQIYDESGWNKVLDKINSLEGIKAEERKYIHFVMSAATTLEIDSQGRVKLPKSLIEFSNLDKDIVVVGNVRSIQIWDKEQWIDYMNKTIDEIPEIMENI